MDLRDLFKQAYEAALLSPDPSTQVGALLVPPPSNYYNKPISGENVWFWGEHDIIARDCNRFPDGVQYTAKRWEKPLKYKVIEHAERNVIYQCAKSGTATKGLILVGTWACCSDCARAIIQAGISKVITHREACDRAPQFWLDEIAVAYKLLEEAGVALEFWSGQLGIKVRHSGQDWVA